MDLDVFLPLPPIAELGAVNVDDLLPLPTVELSAVTVDDFLPPPPTVDLTDD